MAKMPFFLIKQNLFLNDNTIWRRVNGTVPEYVADCMQQIPVHL